MTPEVTLYVAAVLAAATLIAMASGKFDPVLSLMVGLIVGDFSALLRPTDCLPG
jgi:hypothetical protein